jgi:hypothetical protein
MKVNMRRWQRLEKPLVTWTELCELEKEIAVSALRHVTGKARAWGKIEQNAH